MGKRKSQEDALAISRDKKLFILCDGIGSSDNGLKASNLVCEEIIKGYDMGNTIESTADIKELVAAASERLNTKEEQYIATTITLLYLDKKKAYFTYLGDSRIYYYQPSSKRLKRTRDHSLVRDLYDAGILSTEEEMRNHPMKNQITRSLSSTELLKTNDLEVYTINNIVKGDYFMLCSDGVIECFNDKLLKSLFLGNYKFKKIAHYIEEKTSHCSKDNNSAILIKV